MNADNLSLSPSLAVDLQTGADTVLTTTIDWLCVSAEPDRLAAQARFSSPLLRLLARAPPECRRRLQALATKAPALAAVITQALGKRWGIEVSAITPDVTNQFTL
jgi:hypothetical protein